MREGLGPVEPKAKIWSEDEGRSEGESPVRRRRMDAHVAKGRAYLQRQEPGAERQVWWGRLNRMEMRSVF